MKHLKSVAAALVLGLAGLPVAAQPPAEAPADDAVVSELIVPSYAGGPAWWRVADGDSRVYILIVPQTLPRDLAWDRTLLERRLDGAHRLYLPMDIALNPASLLGMAGAAVQAPKLMKELGPRERPKGDKTTLEDKLPPDLRERFIAVRTKIGKPASAYDKLMPDAAAQQIENDYRVWAGLGQGPLASIRAEAKRRRVSDQAIAKFTVPLTKLDVKVTGGRDANCMDQTLQRLETDVRETRRIAEAWAKGDPRPLINPDKKPEPLMCRSLQIGASGAKGKAIAEGLVKDEVRSITGALKQPGKSVVVLYGREMFLADGVLTRLKAMGYEVTTPDVLKD